MRQRLGALLARPTVHRMMQRLQGDAVPIFLLHRVVETPLSAGTRPEAMAEILDTLNRAGCHFVGLDEVVAAVNGTGASLPTSAVCFTADDGYDDQLDLLAPIFEARQCPLTIFLTTGFLDRTSVGWWDRLEHAMAHTSRRQIDDPRPGRSPLPLTAPDERREAMYQYLFEFGRRPSTEAEAMVDRVVDTLEVDAPRVPFGPYQPMSWDGVRVAEARGLVRFGPHTVTHPLLARADDAQAEAEVNGSWSRLQDELADPLPVFCYPVGEDGDYGRRDALVVERNGLTAAVTVGRRHAVPNQLRQQAEGRFRIPRIPVTDVADAVLATSGALRVRHRLRDRAGVPRGGLRPVPGW